MSSRLRLTRPTALLAVVFVVLGVGGGASALGVASVNVSETVTLPPVTGGVKLCVKLNRSEVFCQSTPQPLRPGGTLKVQAQSSAGHAPTLSAGQITCPGDMPGVHILVAANGVDARVSANVEGTGALSGEPIDPVGHTVEVPAGAEADVIACLEP